MMQKLPHILLTHRRIDIGKLVIYRSNLLADGIVDTGSYFLGARLYLISVDINRCRSQRFF